MFNRTLICGDRQHGLLGAGKARYFGVALVSAQTPKPNIVIIRGDDIGLTDISAYSMRMGFHMPDIDRIAKESTKKKPSARGVPS